MSNSKLLKDFGFLSTYNKDYVEKSSTKTVGLPIKQEFADPLNEGFRRYLTLDKSEVSAPYADGEIYQEEFKNRHKKLGEIHFPNPLAKAVIHREDLNRRRTEYQLKYCDLDKDTEYANALKKTIQLPDDVYIPLTTQKSSFRDPAEIFTDALQPPFIVKHFNNLSNNEKINEILGVKTGESEYMDVIGKLGAFVVAEQMHGKIVHPDCNCTTHHPPLA